MNKQLAIKKLNEISLILAVQSEYKLREIIDDIAHWLINGNTNKPSWGDAPNWANWLAQDGNCVWYWYDRKPTAGSATWNPDGSCQYATTTKNWESTLERRPEETKTPEEKLYEAKERLDTLVEILAQSEANIKNYPKSGYEKLDRLPAVPHYTATTSDGEKIVAYRIKE
jgi:hypothetical protein